ncbi:d18c7a67-1476-407d-a348-62dd5cb25109 [Thermothielavioides terrestris]|uniref:D18c7a67-1476-407d-a348-62dd5cb25109 n=1 Tax=Thermothielavioides terrestris TaxID=2587410 RepID=A0A3S4AQE7_9PEZI|nr:d18c7a67-1476-407d-a348-62dd5cb25109 [Thermothielavioides terrestris]
MRPHSAFTLVFAAIAIQGIAAINFVWDCSNAIGTCNNACFAMNHNLAPSVLTKDTRKTQVNERRKASGCRRGPCGKNAKTSFKRFGGSCDEYPFATTKEGGKGAILRCVDGPENSSEGGQLSAFYKKIPDGQKFGITMTNYQKAAFCVNSKKANDGGEFRLKNNAFVSAKRSDNELFEAAPVARDVVNRLREYEDELGRRVLHLSNDPAVTLVGQTISNGTATLLVVREIFEE